MVEVVRLLCAAIVVLASGALPAYLAGGAVGGARRDVTVTARQYGYEPHVITVDRGDVVHVKLVSLDVIHGFYLEGYDIDGEVRPGETGMRMRRPSTGGDYAPVDEITFTASKEGKFRYRCSHTCGFLHPFMLGELIVRPNRLFPAGIGLVFGVLFAGLVLALSERKKGETTGQSLPVVTEGGEK